MRTGGAGGWKAPSGIVQNYPGTPLDTSCLLGAMLGLIPSALPHRPEVGLLLTCLAGGAAEAGQVTPTCPRSHGWGQGTPQPLSPGEGLVTLSLPWVCDRQNANKSIWCHLAARLKGAPTSRMADSGQAHSLPHPEQVTETTDGLF